jgi:hypothetical protein
MHQPMDQLRSVRPEIIGGSFALAPDGNFTETVAFRSEAAAYLSQFFRRWASSGDGRQYALPRPAIGRWTGMSSAAQAIGAEVLVLEQ